MNLQTIPDRAEIIDLISSAANPRFTVTCKATRMTSPWFYKEEYYELEKPKTGNMN